MTTNRERRNRRGSALMLTYFAAVVLSFMVAYGFKSSLDAGKTSEAVATTEQADYAAEYGANLAVSMLSQVALANGDAIGKDWVEAGIFDSGQPKGSDQRRIGGTLGDYDFRVQVRSADLALANNTMPASWLSRDSGSGGSRELMSRNPYKNTYEILATARKRNFSGAVASAAATSAPANTGTTGGYTANDAYTAKVYGIVGMKFGDNPAGLSEPFTTFNADQGTISVGTNNRNDQNHATTFTQPSEEQVAAVFDVDGEDHLLNTVYPKLELSSSKTEIVGAQRGQLKKAGQSIAATGGYWAQGNLTLNFMADSRPVNYKEILTATTHRGVGTPARPNPYVPLTRTFDYTYTDTNTGHDDRQMTSKYKQFNNNDTNNNDDFYTKDFYHNNVGDKAVLPVEQRLSPTSNPPLALDRYFLGGKRTSGSTDSNSGNGRSVTLQTFNGGEVYSLGKDVLDDVLYKGTKSGETYSGVIAQKHVDGLIKIDDPNSKLDVLVGSYVELKRFYMTYVPDWRTVFVGEWTNGTRKPTDSKSSADNMLFDNNGGTLRKRSFSKHYPMNKDGKILVHEMKWYNTSANSIVETGTSGEARVWTGRYKWVKPNFKNKFWVLDEKGKKVYPREFTWEEITGQKSKRATTGKLSGSDYGTYEAEVDESGALVSIKKMDSSVVRDGYPVTDILGREVPEVKADASGQDVLRDENGTPIFVPAGLTEYCSVNASDPSELIPVYFDNTSIDEYGIPEVVKQTGPSPITTNGYNNKTRQFARRNFIEVVEDDGSIRYYNDISDFEYLSDVTLEDGTVQKDRRVATIAIGMEDNYEEKSDFDYTDIMFVLNVVPAQDTTTTVIRGDNNESSKFIQWWELPTDAGLTGGPSQTPLSSTETPASKVAPQDERIAANYDHLVGSSDITATSLLDGDTGLEISYHRIKFDGNGEIVRPDDYQSGEIIYYYLAKNASVAGNDIDPDNYDDIFEFVSQELQQSDSKDEYKSCNTDMERKQRGLARLLKQADTKGLTLKDIDARGAPEKRSLAELPDQPTFTGASENDYLYNIREERYTARRQAKLAFGGDGVTIAVGNTDAALNRERGDDNIMRPASREQHLFLAGEVAPKQRYEDDAPEPRPVLHRIMRQPVNSYVPDMFVNGGALERLANYGVFDSKIGDNQSRNTVVTEIADRSLEQGSLPSLFLSAKTDTAPGSNTFDTTAVMELVYSSMLPELEMREIRKLLRIDEERTILGWHRGGKDEDLAAFHLQDSYVAAMLTADNLQPYTLANPYGEDAGEVVAKIRHEAISGDNAVVTHLVNIDTGSRLPTFTFDKPFDGAGILVVNGNLVVKSTFAYYGLVIVLGDIIIEPTEGDYWRRDAAGFFTDPDGNRIYWDGTKEEWFSLREEETSGGATKYKTRIPAGAPEKTRQYKGEMAVQGKILVGGDVEVKCVGVANSRVNDNLHPDSDNMNSNVGNTVSPGKFTVVASEAAMQMAAEDFRDEDGGLVGRFLLNKQVWNTNSDDDVGHIWENAVER